MKRGRCLVKGPFLDAYSVGFRLYQPGAVNWRQRTIAGVSWNGEEQEAIFFNPDGLVLPIKANPWELPELLRSTAVSREFSHIHGDGHFAIKAGDLASLKSLDLTNWVTYWLINQSAGYANDSAEWQRLSEAELAREKAACECLHREIRMTSNLASYLDECLTDRRELLAREHREGCIEDSKILAWLKGETPSPVLGNTQGAA